MWQDKDSKDINIWDRIGMGLYAAGGGDPADARMKSQSMQSKQAFINALDSGQLNGQSSQGQSQPQFIKIPDYNSPTGFKLEIDPRWSEQVKGDAQQKNAQSKALAVETADWKSGKAFLETMRKKWLEGRPPKTGILGLGGSGVLPQPLYGVQQKLGSLLQFTDNQKKDNLYISYANALKSRLAKGGIIGKDVGNLSIQEQGWVMQGVPSIMDYDETGNAKIDNMKEMLDTMFYARKQGYKSIDEMMADKGHSYFKGQIISKGNKSYKVIGGDLTKDPDIEEIK